MTLYMCDYDWSSGSFVFKQIDRSIYEKNPEIFG